MSEQVPVLAAGRRRGRRAHALRGEPRDRRQRLALGGGQLAPAAAQRGERGLGARGARVGEDGGEGRERALHDSRP
jgi:hypothetical protein